MQPKSLYSAFVSLARGLIISVFVFALPHVSAQEQPKKDSPEANKPAPKQTGTIDPETYLTGLARKYKNVKSIAVKLISRSQTGVHSSQTVVDLEWMRPNKAHIIVKTKTANATHTQEFICDGNEAYEVNYMPAKFVRKISPDNVNFTIHCVFLMKLLRGELKTKGISKNATVKRVAVGKGFHYRVTVKSPVVQNAKLTYTFDEVGYLLRIQSESSSTISGVNYHSKSDEIYSDYMVNKNLNDKDFEISEELKTNANTKLTPDRLRKLQGDESETEESEKTTEPAKDSGAKEKQSGD